MSLIISSTVKVFLGLGEGFGCCGVGFAARVAAVFGAAAGRLTGATNGSGDKGGVMLVSGAASTVGLGISSFEVKLTWLEFVWLEFVCFELSVFEVCKNKAPKIMPPSSKKIRATEYKIHDVLLFCGMVNSKFVVSFGSVSEETV